MTDYPELYQLMDSMDSGSYSYGGPYAATAGAGVWALIAFILAIVGGILLYCLFVRPKTEPKGKFARWLKDFLSFKIMWIEPILKVVYYMATIFIVLYSFTFLGMMGYLGGLAFVYFLVCLVLGPVLVRIAYEAAMMFIMIWRNTQDISDHTKKK